MRFMGRTETSSEQYATHHCHLRGYVYNNAYIWDINIPFVTEETSAYTHTHERHNLDGDLDFPTARNLLQNRQAGIA